MIFIYSESSSSSLCASNSYVPRLLNTTLPSQGHIADVWCGAEFTIVADDINGSLFGCGWNEHSNVIANDRDRHVNEWSAVMYKNNNNSSDDDVKESNSRAVAVCVHLWEGSVACGGGHVLAIHKHV